MLSLRHIDVEGFGPFAEPQRLEIPDQAGVTLVYGENMRGKTSLLNAIRYAFYGQVLGRGSRERRLHTVSNRALAAQGKYGFKVRLGFDHDGTDYQLVRSCTPLDGVVRPKSDSDYRQSLSLRSGSSILGPGERATVLERVLPEQISRFFLFDGELLQEYEKLLFEGDNDGRKISEAIERILGVPILKRARARLSDLADEADIAEAKQASLSKNTEALGNALKAATDRKKHHQGELARLEGELKDLKTQQSEAEAFLKTQQKFLSIIEERDRAETRLESLKSEVSDAESELRGVMVDSWRTILSGPVAAAREVAAKDAARAIDRLTMKLRERSAAQGQCETCDQSISDDLALKLIETLPSGLATEGMGAAERLVDLNRIIVKDVTALVTQLSHRLAKGRAEMAGLKDEIKDKKTELQDADVDRLEGDSVNLADTMRKVVVTETGIDGHRKKIEEADKAIKKLKTRLAKLGSADLQTSQTRSRLLRSATEVLQAAVEQYKSDLRARVQATATELFLKMTTEDSEYAGLQITPNYGLNLLHSDQAIEDGRSAGAEHVIALALMGALQRNAPIRGPIIMDSPFGRLDEGHTENVLAALPSMASQVVLLVHSAEVQQNRVREILGSHLLREYELVKVSSRRTKIEQVR